MFLYLQLSSRPSALQKGGHVLEQDAKHPDLAGSTLFWRAGGRVVHRAAADSQRGRRGRVREPFLGPARNEPAQGLGQRGGRVGDDRARGGRRRQLHLRVEDQLRRPLLYWTNFSIFIEGIRTKCYSVHYTFDTHSPKWIFDHHLNFTICKSVCETVHAFT